MDNARYLIYLIVTAFFTIVCVKTIRSVDGEAYPNYLYNPAVNLDHHLISHTKKEAPTIIHLGSSAVIGNNYPQQTTIADYINKISSKAFVYNLGSMEGTILSAYIYLKMSEKFNPKAVILGISPDLFSMDSISLRVIQQNLDLLNSDFDQKFISYISSKKKYRLSNFSKIFNEDRPTIPPISKLKIFDELFWMKRKIFGPTFLDDIYKLKGTTIDNVLKSENPLPNIIINLINLCKKNNLPVYFYFEPQYGIEFSYGENKYNLFKNLINGIVQKEGYSVVDYSEKLPQSSNYFLDFLHLTPDGNEQVAKFIYNDFVKNLEMNR